MICAVIIIITQQNHYAQRYLCAILFFSTQHGHPQGVTCVKFSPNGQYLFSGTELMPGRPCLAYANFVPLGTGWDTCRWTQRRRYTVLGRPQYTPCARQNASLVLGESKMYVITHLVTPRLDLLDMLGSRFQSLHVISVQFDIEPWGGRFLATGTEMLQWCACLFYLTEIQSRHHSISHPTQGHRMGPYCCMI